MKRKFCYVHLSLIGLLLSCSDSFEGRAKSMKFYSDSSLQKRREGTCMRIEQKFRSLIINRIPEKHRSSAAEIRLRFPLRPEYGDSPLAFYSFPKQKEIHLPVRSIQFFDDLCIAYAWLDHNGYGVDTFFAYLGMLKANNARSIPNSRISPPLEALRIPDDAMDNSIVADTVDKLFGSAIVWIISHEVGHIAHRHSGYSGKFATKAQEQETEADLFADETMRNIGVPPIGIVIFFRSVSALDQNRSEYSNESEWVHYVTETRTHPLSGERLKRMATELRKRPSAYPELDRSGVYSLALEIEQIGLLSEDPLIHKALHILGTKSTWDDLKPSKQNTVLRNLAQQQKKN